MSDKEADVARNYDKSGPKGMSVSDGQDGSNDFPKTEFQNGKGKVNTTTMMNRK